MSRRTYFVTAETVRLALSEDDWIDVKKGLAYGERAHVRSLLYGRVSETGVGDPGIDLEAASIEFLVAWIVDWSFTDANGKPVAVTRDAVRALDPDLADEAQAAIAEHMQAMSLGKATPNGKPKRAARSA